jgi:hypothetical protein
VRGSPSRISRDRSSVARQTKAEHSCLWHLVRRERGDPAGVHDAAGHLGAVRIIATMNVMVRPHWAIGSAMPFQSCPRARHKPSPAGGSKARLARRGVPYDWSRALPHWPSARRTEDPRGRRPGRDQEAGFRASKQMYVPPSIGRSSSSTGRDFQAGICLSPYRDRPTAGRGFARDKYHQNQYSTSKMQPRDARPALVVEAFICGFD